MKLHTAYYLANSSCEMPDPMIGLPDLRKGLNTILLGYLLSFVGVLIMGGAIWYLLAQTGGKHLSWKTTEEVSTVLFAAALLVGLAMIGSVLLIVRGKWMCLLSAPEQYHAKWLMFLSILCILAGPTLSLGAFLVGETKTTAQGRGRINTAAVLLQKIEKYEHGMPELDTRGYIGLAGQAAGLFSTIFFALFLRAAALSWGARWRARFTELYLLLMGFLVAGVVVLFWRPAFLLARPQLLLGLGGGWLIAGLWYFVLILSTTECISNVLAKQPRKETDFDSGDESRNGSGLDFIG